MSNITNADLLGINPILVEKEVKMEIIFSETAKWIPKEVLKVVIPVTEWLQFLENCFIQFKEPEHTFTSPSLSLEFQKSQVKLIGCNSCFFTIPKNKWRRFVEEQVENYT